MLSHRWFLLALSTAAAAAATGLARETIDNIRLIVDCAVLEGWESHEPRQRLRDPPGMVRLCWAVRRG